MELVDAADAQDVLGIQGAGHQLSTLFHPLSILDEQLSGRQHIGTHFAVVCGKCDADQGALPGLAYGSHAGDL